MNLEKAIKIIKIVEFILILAIITLVPVYFDAFQETFNSFILNKIILFRILASILAIVCLLEISLSGRIRLYRDKLLFIFWGIVGGYLIIANFFSLHPQISFFGCYFRNQGVLSFLFYLLFFILLICHIVKFKQFKQLSLAAAIGSLFVCLYGLIQILGLDPYLWSEQGARIFSTTGQPNFLSYYLILAIPLTVYALFFAVKKFIPKFLIFIIIVFQLLNLFFTYSRASWLGFLFGLVFLILLLLFLRGYKKIVFSLLGIIFLTSVIFIFNFQSISSQIRLVNDSIEQPIIKRLLSSFYLDKGSNQIRINYWQSVLTEFKQASWQRKLLGYGKESQPDIFIKYYNSDWALMEKLDSFPDRAHNFIMDTWLETGLLGMLFLFLFHVYIIWQSFKYLLKGHPTKEEYWWLVMGLTTLAGYNFANLFGFSLGTHYVYYYFILASLYFVANKNKSKIYNLHKLRLPSRIIIWSATALFLIIFNYYFNVRLLLADHYYMEAKKAEAKSDCLIMLENMNKVVSMYPTSPFFKDAFITISSNCSKYVSSKKDLVNLINNVLDQADSYGPKEKTIHTERVIAQAYALFGYYVNESYYNKAEEMYQELIVINPNVSIMYQNYGRMKLWQKDYNAAIAIFNRGLNILPIVEPSNSLWAREFIEEKEAYFYKLIGDVYYAQENWKQALEYYQKILTLRPLFIPGYKSMVDVYYQQSNLQQAIVYSEKALRLDINKLPWQKDLLLLYNEQGNKQEALLLAKEILIQEPGNVVAKELIIKYE
ncbi:MAG: O-antigen ligase family protein [Patescibacteria group bacterium]